MSRRIYKIEVVSYPTPDGKPFKDQPDEHYWAAYEIYCGGEDDRCPDWLRETNIDGWVYHEGEYGLQPGDYRGYGILDDSDRPEPFMDVPRVWRTHYFSRAAAARIVKGLRSWGAVVNLHESKLIEWEPLAPSTGQEEGKNDG